MESVKIMKICLIHLLPSNAFSNELFNTFQSAHNENVVILFWLLFWFRYSLQLSFNKIIFLFIILQARLRLILDTFNNLYCFSNFLIGLRTNLQWKEKRVAAFVLCFILKVNLVFCAFTAAEQINHLKVLRYLYVLIVKDGWLQLAD